jgi:drug/metabolite transporter (DMT)-like permease
VRAVDYALTLVAALVLGVGFVLQQHAAEQTPKSHFLSLKLIGDLFRKRLWLAGIAAMIGGQILAAWSIGNLELSIVEPLLTTNLLFALILAVPLSHQAVRVTEVAGAVLLIAGEALLEVARSAQPIGQSFGSFAHWPAAALIAGVAFAAVQAGRQRHDSRRATLTGLGAGLVFGIQDALTRQTLQILQHHGLAGLLQSWSAYCLVATGAVGVLLMQYAFSAGPLHASLPTIAAGEPVAGILLGIVVFGDRISLSPTSLAMQAGGLFALVVGVIAVARAPALSAVRKAVTEPVHLPHPHFRDHRPGATPPHGHPIMPPPHDQSATAPARSRPAPASANGQSSPANGQSAPAPPQASGRPALAATGQPATAPSGGHPATVTAPANGQSTTNPPQASGHPVTAPANGQSATTPASGYPTPANGQSATASGQPGRASHNGHSDPAIRDDGEQPDQPAPRTLAPAPVTPRRPGAASSPGTPGASAAPDTGPDGRGPGLPPGSAPAAAVAPLFATDQAVPPIGPVGPIGPIEPGGPVSHLGPPSLMAPAQPPMAVPPDCPLDPL